MSLEKKPDRHTTQEIGYLEAEHEANLVLGDSIEKVSPQMFVLAAHI